MTEGLGLIVRVNGDGDALRRYSTSTINGSTAPKRGAPGHQSVHSLVHARSPLPRTNAGLRAVTAGSNVADIGRDPAGSGVPPGLSILGHEPRGAIDHARLCSVANWRPTTIRAELQPYSPHEACGCGERFAIEVHACGCEFTTDSQDDATYPVAVCLDHTTGELA